MEEQNGSHREMAAPKAALFEGIFASAMDAIIAVDQAFIIIAFNPAAEAMFGVAAASVLGQPLERFIPERYHDSHRRHVAHFAQDGETYRRMGAIGAVRAVRANGEEFNIEASIAQTSVEGEPAFSVIMREARAHDASSLETALLAREVDHRAKNILAIVSSLISLTTADSQADYADALAGRIAALARANALLSVKRWKGAALALLLRDELLAQTDEGKLVLDGPDIPLSSRSVQPLGMLVHELASNAVRHGALSVPGGTVELRWADEADGGLRLSWRERGGPAVRQPAREGLGLTLIRQIVGGQLGATCALSWAAEGFSFEAHLPPAIRDCRRSLAPTPQESEEADALPAASPPPPQPVTKSTGTLLIVEDEPILAMQLSRALGDFGWSVIGVAGSIEAADRLLAEHPRPDAAILDVDLAGVPVFPFARALRVAGIPFLFCTGFEDISYNREFSDCTVVRKPATALQIVGALRRTVHEAGLAAG